MKTNDPLMVDLRKRYPKNGPNPGKDINKWAAEYMSKIGDDIQKVERLIHIKVPIEEISKATGLRLETIKALYPSKRK